MANAHVEIPIYLRVADNSESQLGVMRIDPAWCGSDTAREHLVAVIRDRVGALLRDIAAEAPGAASFTRELQDLINRHSVDNDANTPDMILVRYLNACLHAFTDAVEARDRHNTPPSLDVLLGQAIGIEGR